MISAPGPDVPGEQADDGPLPLALQGGFAIPGRTVAAPPAEHRGKVGQVGRLQPFDVRVGRFDAVDGEQFAGDAGVGPAAVRDAVAGSRSRRTPICKPGFHGRLAGPAGADQGAVDVKEEDAHLASIGPVGGVGPVECFMPGSGRDR